MRSKAQNSINLKLFLLFFFLVSIILFIFRSTLSSPSTVSSPTSQTRLSNSTSYETEESESESVPESVLGSESESVPESESESESATNTPCSSLPFTPTCTKAPPSLADALIHYATSNTTPQQTFTEISVSARVLSRKSPCNFLVFGLGHDSLMWTALNHGGRTVFLEEDEAWIEQIRRRLPTLEAYHVVYSTKVHQADQLLRIGEEKDCKIVEDPRFSKCQLAHKGFPTEVYDMEWDLIMVDAPTGYFDGAPGRMSAIYTAGLMARNRETGETDIFVHDVDRVVEDKFSKAFLCEGYLMEQEGRIRRFTVPSHKARLGRPFCP